MAIKSKIEQELNEQINKEMFSGYLYLSMSAYFTRENLTGFATWMKIQSDEETLHAMKIYNFVLDRGGKVELKKIEKPKVDWKSAQEVFKETLAHEEFITASIHKLYDLAVKEKDPATQVMLQWFVNEQVEEEANVGEILEKLKMIGNDKQNLLILDQQLGTRVLPPTTTTE